MAQEGCALLEDVVASADAVAAAIDTDALAKCALLPVPAKLSGTSEPPHWGFEQGPGVSSAQIVSLPRYMIEDALLGAPSVYSYRYLAQKCPEEGPGAAKRKKEFEEQRSALAAALAAKVKALLDAEDAANEPPPADAAAAAAEAAASSEALETAAAGGEAADGDTTAAAPAQEEAAEAAAGSGKQLAEDDAVEQAFRWAAAMTAVLSRPASGNCDKGNATARFRLATFVSNIAL